MRKLSCWGQFVALFFGQLTGQQSLRDLVTTLDAGRKKLQQVGRGAVSRSPLADANRKRPQEIFGELFGCLYQRCRRQAPGQRFGFRHRVYSLDATVIDLCLKVFDWAKFRKRKGAIKLHLILDHGGHIPSFCVMTPGREHEIEVARGQRYEPDRILSFDRAYVDYHWFDQLHRQGVYFVTRQKRNARYRVLQRREVAAIYKARWQIELFFKWVKQHLKIKSFLGTTANAVMTQVWVALCVYLLVAYVKFLLRPPGRLYEIFKRLQVTALEYLALGQVLAWETQNGPKRAPKWRQRNLFGRRLKPFFVGG